MAVTLLESVKVGGGTMIRWTSDQPNPTFRVLINGVERYRTRHTSVIVPITKDEAVLVEVLDDESKATPAASSRGRVAIAEDASADHFRIEQNVGGDYVLQSVARQGGNNGAKSYRTPPLADSEDHEFRVTPVSPEGNQGAAATATLSMRRHPDPPAVTSVAAEYNGTLNTTIVTIS
ncbi:MAG: hypothetical protein ACPGXK_00245 [Phycisphaerae bacterium]